MFQLPENCQTIIIDISSALNDYAAAAAVSPVLPTHLSIPPYALALFSSFWGQFHTPLIVIVPRSARQCQSFLKEASAWAEAFPVRRRWHLLASPLAEQELSGLVSSQLGLAYHRLFAAALEPKDHPHCFIIPHSLLDELIPGPAAYAGKSLQLYAGEPFRLSDLQTALVRLGYVRYRDTLSSGGFRARGEELSLKHPAWPNSYSITFHGSLIETITESSGARTVPRPRLTIPPHSFPAPSVTLRSQLKNFALLRPQAEDLSGSSTVIFNSLSPAAAFPFQPFTTNASLSGRHCLVFFRNRDRTEALLKTREAVPTFCRSALSQIPMAFSRDEDVFLSEHSLFPDAPGAAPLTFEQGIDLLANLTAGEPAVHADHGIGIYEGLQPRVINGEQREYLVLRYAAGDTLSVPVEYAFKVSPYLGEAPPVLHRLGGALWQKTRRQAAHDAKAFAQELLSTAGERSRSFRPSYPLESSLENQLEASFPFALTPDQQQAWLDIQDDLSRSQPMDRLVVGDVGFGKTELAIRAAGHVVASGGQVAVLAPTTLLVQQHTDTFRARLPAISAQVVTLSRFSTSREQAAARKSLASGQAAIAIGTHALLSTSTAWHNLKLVIIDEEQRFGVKQKEHFKKLRASLDILSLTATPIPRTLSLALSGLKQLSVLSTAPLNRKSVITLIRRDSDAVFQTALQREKNRAGQVYVVAPRIQGLSALAYRLRRLMPETKIAVAHGQLPARDLARIMAEFDAGALDVLVSSAIIENGLDLPRANTIIVTDATRFGLADLYQLRGRVGRREQQGYAYFLYQKESLKLEERDRLAAITEASRLGSGWSLARRDLEIRGAGNILGAEQSGAAAAVGVQFYLDLVREAVASKNAAAVHRRDVLIELPLPAIIPVHYVADAELRAEIYQRLSRAATPAVLQKEISRLTGLYGSPPPDTLNLFALLRLQHAAAAAGVTQILSRLITPADEEPYHRLTVSAQSLPSVLPRLNLLGAWRARADALTHDVRGLNRAFIERFAQALAATA